MNHLVAPSILSMDFSKIREEVEMINRSEADWFHVDVMDGVFVPNISLGFPIVEAINQFATKPLDVHLMIVNPEKYVTDFAKCGATNLTVQYEACTHLDSTIQQIKESGMNAGVALNPHTPICLLEEVLEKLDVVCLMSVNPGFGGQKFIKSSLKKISKLRKLIDETNPSVRLEVDGGVKLNNAKEIIDAGADVIVSGSGVFGTENPVETISKMKNL
jgi:ribulose-phosphate 3-epimerase